MHSCPQAFQNPTAHSAIRAISTTGTAFRQSSERHIDLLPCVHQWIIIHQAEYSVTNSTKCYHQNRSVSRWRRLSSTFIRYKNIYDDIRKCECTSMRTRTVIKYLRRIGMPSLKLEKESDVIFVHDLHLYSCALEWPLEILSHADVNCGRMPCVTIAASNCRARRADNTLKNDHEMGIKICLHARQLLKTTTTTTSTRLSDLSITN